MYAAGQGLHRGMNWRSSRKPRSSILVGFVEKRRREWPTCVQRPALDMIAQAARAFPTTIWAPRSSVRRSCGHVHSADASCDARAGFGIKARPVRARPAWPVRVSGRWRSPAGASGAPAGLLPRPSASAPSDMPKATRLAGFRSGRETRRSASRNSGAKHSLLNRSERFNSRVLPAPGLLPGWMVARSVMSDLSDFSCLSPLKRGAMGGRHVRANVRPRLWGFIKHI